MYNSYIALLPFDTMRKLSVSDGTLQIPESSAPNLTKDLATLFQNNPWLIDTPDGIASRIGRTLFEIQKALDYFINLGLLIVKKVGEITLISLNSTKWTEKVALGEVPTGGK
jgi:hypothetical protein